MWTAHFTKGNCIAFGTMFQCQCNRIDVELSCTLHAQGVNLFFPDNGVGAEDDSNIDSNLTSDCICQVQCVAVGLFDGINRFRQFVGESGLVDQAKMCATSICEIPCCGEASAVDVQMKMRVPNGAGPSTLDDCHVHQPSRFSSESRCFHRRAAMATNFTCRASVAIPRPLRNSSI